jgi:heptosyltransferase II
MSAAEPNVAVIQPLPGVGDMIWHLPHIRAISAHVGAPVTLVAKPRSAAAQIFAAERTVRDVIWMDRNPERRRGRHDGPLGMLRLIRDLRARHFDAVYLLHQSQTLACVTWLSRIPARHGYGAGSQRLWLNRPAFLSREALRLNWYQQATTWLGVAGIPVAEAEPRLPVLQAAAAAVEQRLGPAVEPLITIGIGSSELYKQWGATRFAALVQLLRQSGWTRFVLLGGPPQADVAAEILRLLGGQDASVAVSVDWPLTEVAALLARSAFYVGNDTGFLNIAAAVGIRTYGLFGATDPFHHSSQIVPISPVDGGVSRIDGMSRISAEAVLAVILADRGSAPQHLSPGERSTRSGG